MPKKYRITSLTKFTLILAIVGVSMYSYLEYNNDKTETEHMYLTYIHKIPEGHLALRNRELSIKEYKSITKNKKLNEETYIKEIPANEIVELIDEGNNSFYIKMKDRTKGFIAKSYANHSTLKRADQKQ